MDFAIVSILVILLAAPGFVLRRSYFSFTFSSHFTDTSTFNELVWSLVPSIAIHCVALWFGGVVCHITVIGEYIGFLLTGNGTDDTLKDIFLNVHHNAGVILLYNVVLIGLAFFVGHLLRKIVRLCELDHRWKLFRYPNDWLYILKGEYVRLAKGYNTKKLKVNLITVDVLLLLDDKPIIYSGILEHATLSKNGGLDRLQLLYPSKKAFAWTDDDKLDKRQIPGNRLVIPYERIINFNINYYNLKKLGPPEPLKTSL